MRLRAVVSALGASGVLLVAGCRPAAPPAPAPASAPAPPDLLAPQRAALERAKAVEGQLKQGLDERMKAVDPDTQ